MKPRRGISEYLNAGILILKESQAKEREQGERNAVKGVDSEDWKRQGIRDCFGLPSTSFAIYHEFYVML